MDASMNYRPGPDGVRRSRLGRAVRRMVGGAILLSGTVIFASEVRSSVMSGPSQATAASLHAGSMFASK